MRAGGGVRRDRPATPSTGVGCDRGAAAVELALVLPVLLLLLFGIIDFGRMLNAQITLTEATREGARAASLGFDAAARLGAAANGIPLSAVAVTGCAGGVGLAGDATVVASHAFQPVTPLGEVMRLFGATEDGSVTITARGVMPCVG